jgi:hypothetical protein
MLGVRSLTPTIPEGRLVDATGTTKSRLAKSADTRTDSGRLPVLENVSVASSSGFAPGATSAAVARCRVTAK